MPSSRDSKKRVSLAKSPRVRFNISGLRKRPEQPNATIALTKPCLRYGVPCGVSINLRSSSRSVLRSTLGSSSGSFMQRIALSSCETSPPARPRFSDGAPNICANV